MLSMCRAQSGKRTKRRLVGRLTKLVTVGAEIRVPNGEAFEYEEESACNLYNIYCRGGRGMSVKGESA